MKRNRAAFVALAALQLVPTVVPAASLQEGGGLDAPSVSPHSVVAAVAPDYPELAAQARVSAAIPVDVEIGADGVPVGARATVKVPPLFKGVAESAALRWRFAPLPMSLGELTHITLTFSFQARDDWSCNEPAERTVTFRPPFEVQISVRPYVCCLPAVTTKQKKNP